MGTIKGHHNPALKIIHTLKLLRSRQMCCIFLLGMISGLPLALTGATLTAWYATTEINIQTIGALSFIGLPYTVKFLWAPILDKFRGHFLDQRRMWMFAMMLALTALTLWMSFFEPQANPKTLALIALIVAISSATFDMAFDAYKVESLNTEEKRGLGASLGAEGYRMGMLIAGAGALSIAHYSNFKIAYQAMALFFLLGLFGVLFAPQLTTHQTQKIEEKSLVECYWLPLQEFFSRKNGLWFLALILLYKFGDALTLALSSVFLIRELSLSLLEVAYLNKVIGTIAVLLGMFAGGIMLTRLSLFKALLFFACLQAVSSLSYWALAIVHSPGNLFISNAIFIEFLCAGMGTAAFVALLMHLCNTQFSATQFAFFSAFGSIGRVFTGPLASWLVENIGWANYYLVSVALCLPGILLIIKLKNPLHWKKRHAYDNLSVIENNS